MDMNDQLQNIQSKDDLAKFVEILRIDLNANPNNWENLNLNDYLSAIAAWINDMDGYYKNIGEATPSTPAWKNFAEILSAASVYE